MLSDFEQNEQVSFDFITENIGVFMSGAHKMNSIMQDCINPTEVMLEDIYEVLMEPEVTFKLDIEKSINLDFIETHSTLFNDLKAKLESGIDAPIEKKMYRHDSTGSNDVIDNKGETKRDLKQFLGDFKLYDENLHYDGFTSNETTPYGSRNAVTVSANSEKFVYDSLNSVGDKENYSLVNEDAKIPKSNDLKDK